MNNPALAPALVLLASAIFALATVMFFQRAAERKASKSLAQVVADRRVVAHMVIVLTDWGPEFDVIDPEVLPRWRWTILHRMSDGTLSTRFLGNAPTREEARAYAREWILDNVAHSFPVTIEERY